LKFTELKLKGAYLIELEPFEDDRGTFTRQFCKKELKEHGIDFEICQCNISKNYKKGTLRGMHFQNKPYREAKMVSCIKGAFLDVIIDLREDSETYLQWEAVEMSEGNNKTLYIPPDFAQGFQTFEDNTIIFYEMGNYYMQGETNGFRWNDQKLAIQWPTCENRIINKRDNSYPLL
jgi:dTDP-4-dehydrorhamnose 3,5-epimerase